MSARLAEPPTDGCTFWRTELRYDARAHFEWLLYELNAGDVLYRLRDEGTASRLAGLAWRELAAHELESNAGDAARARRYAGRARKRIESLLPASLKPLVPFIVLDVQRTMEVEIGPGRALRSDWVDDLQNLCRRRHAGEALSKWDRDRLAHRLAAINPSFVKVYAALPGGVAPLGLEHAAINATAAAGGSWTVVASAAGYLPVGRAEAVAPGRVAVEPRFTFTREV
jgi:hypothetical protein